MNVYYNDSKLVRIFLFVLWSSVHRSLGSSPSGSLITFSKAIVDAGSLHALVSSQQTGSPKDCARACMRRREEEPKCEGWRFDSQESLCHLYNGSFYEASNTMNGIDMYRHAFNWDTFPPPPIPASPNFQHARDAAYRYGSYYMSHVNMTYYQAVDYCQALGAYLLHINGTWEYNVLIVVTRWVDSDDPQYWLGAFRPQRNGNWISQKYRKPLDPLVWTWGPDAPSDAPYEDCAVIDVYAKDLFNRRCDTQRQAVCENHNHP